MTTTFRRRGPTHGCRSPAPRTKIASRRATISDASPDAADVLILAYSNDSGVDSVQRHLSDAGVSSARLNTLGTSSRIFTFDPHSGLLSTESGPVPRADLVWNRTVRFHRDRAIDPDYREFAHDEIRQAMLGSLHSICPAWFPDPGRMARAGLKPLQLQLAANDRRLRVPATLVTADPGQARAFIAGLDGGCIVKGLGRPVITRGPRTSVMYTTVVDDRIMRSLESLHIAPVIFQQFIERDHDIRVTVIGDEVFATRIDTDDPGARSDWRIGGLSDSLRYAVAAIDPDVADACRDMLAQLGLRFGCFDFAVDAHGEWFFLEVNPNGQWYWVEMTTGVAMARAMAGELVRQLQAARHGRAGGCMIDAGPAPGLT